jgi:Uma2 family endonuclease
MGLSLLELPLPIRIVPAAPLSDDEFLAFCRDNEPYQFEQDAKGEIIVMTPTGGEGGNLEGYIFRELDLWVERTGLGFAFNANVCFRLPDKSLRMPDAAWVTLDRWNALTKSEKRKFPPFCPDFVVELRSDSDRAKALEEKMQIWMSNGAQLAWLIDPVRKLAIVYRGGQQPKTLLKPEVLEGEGPIAGFRLEMERFWA